MRDAQRSPRGTAIADTPEDVRSQRARVLAAGEGTVPVLDERPAAEHRTELEASVDSAPVPALTPLR